MKERRTFKEKLAEQLHNRINVINSKLKGYDTLVKERTELQSALAGLTSNGTNNPTTKSNNIEEDGLDNHFNPSDATPLSIEALELLSKLPNEFDSGDLKARLDNNQQKAMQWIAGWKRGNLIDTVRRGVFARKQRMD